MVDGSRGDTDTKEQPTEKGAMITLILQKRKQRLRGWVTCLRSHPWLMAELGSAQVPSTRSHQCPGPGEATRHLGQRGPALAVLAPGEGCTTSRGWYEKLQNILA